MKSLRRALEMALPETSLNKGIAGLVNPLYGSTRGLRELLMDPLSISRIIDTLSWPAFSGSYNLPDEGENYWNSRLQGVAHDDDNWFFSREPADEHDTALIRVPVEWDLNDDLSDYRLLLCPFADTTHAGDLDYAVGYSGGLLVVPFEAEDKDKQARFAFCDSNLEGWFAFADIEGQGEDGPWCAINPINGLIYTSKFYGGPGEAVSLNVYRSGLLPPHAGSPLIEHVGTMPLFYEDGTPFIGWNIQGGAFSRRGHLYLSVAYPQDDDQSHIECFDMISGRRAASLPFEVHPGWSLYQEPEGITIWDLDSGRAPGITGQIHQLMMGHDSDLWFKHFAASPAALV